MTITIAPIVEGHGEVKAVPNLLRNLAQWLDPSLHLTIVPPLRENRSRLAKREGLCRAVEFMANKSGPDGKILVILDADDDCPAALGPQLREWATCQRPDRAISVVVANREFEAWYLASIQSLRGRRGLDAGADAPEALEAVRDAKGWLASRMTDGYSETLDQPAFAALVDPALARVSPSFDKLVRDFANLVGRAAPPFVHPQAP